MNKYYEDGLDPDQISVHISEMLVATNDGSDELIDRTVGKVLRMLRTEMRMDVVFVAEFVDGQRVLRKVDAIDNAPVEVGASDPVETTYCQRVIDGRLPQFMRDVGAAPANVDVPPTPFKVGSYITAPIALEDGSIYGTLCAFCQEPRPELAAQDLKNLQLAAALAARNIHPNRSASPASKPTDLL